MNHTVVSLFTEELSFRRYHFLSSRSVHKKGGLMLCTSVSH